MQTLYDILTHPAIQYDACVGDVVQGVVTSCNSLLLNTYESITLGGTSIHHLVDSGSIPNHAEVVVVQVDVLVDVSDTILDGTDGWVLEAALWVLAPVVEDTRLLIDVLNLQRLKLPASAQLHIL